MGWSHHQHEPQTQRQTTHNKTQQHNKQVDSTQHRTTLPPTPTTHPTPTTTQRNTQKWIGQNWLAKIDWPDGLAKNGSAKIGLAKVGLNRSNFCQLHLDCWYSFCLGNLCLEEVVLFVRLDCEHPSSGHMIFRFDFPEVDEIKKPRFQPRICTLVVLL